MLTTPEKVSVLALTEASLAPSSLLRDAARFVHVPSRALLLAVWRCVASMARLRCSLQLDQLDQPGWVCRGARAVVQRNACPARLGSARLSAREAGW